MFFRYFKNIITPEKCEELNRITLALYREQKLTYEGNDPHYKNSFGTGSLPECDALYEQFTPMIKRALNTRFITEINTYARIYLSGSELNPHVDRPGLDLTMSLCTYTNLDTPWPIYVEVAPGKVARVVIPPGDAAVFLGTGMKHWREPLVCTPEQMVIQSFYHWQIDLPNLHFCQFG